MVGVCGVDHHIGQACLFAENAGVIQGPEHRGDTQRLQGLALLWIAQQATDLMACIHQVFGDGAADVAGRAGHENLHCLLLISCLMTGLRGRKEQALQILERLTIRSVLYMS